MTITKTGATAIFVRHGNTFDPGDLVTSVGGKQNLPLSSSGRAQLPGLKERLTKLLESKTPKVFSSPLVRACQTAAVLSDQPELVPILAELDVGRWGGLTNEQIEAREEDRIALHRWNEFTELPSVFVVNQTQHDRELRAYLKSLLSYPLSVSFTHGGILKLIGKLHADPTQKSSSWKVSTTGICVLSEDSSSATGLKIQTWNQ